MILSHKQYRKMGLFSDMFGGGGGNKGGGSANGGIVHNGGNGRVQQLPRANPQENNGNPNGGGQQNVQSQQQEQVDPILSPLDGLKGLWQTPTMADGKPVPQQVDPLAAPLFQFDPKQVQERTGAMDFTGGISPELAGKALGGDVDAFKEAINSAVRLAFTAGTLNTGNLLNDGFARHGRNIDAALPTRVRNIQVAQTKSEDPILSHPSVDPLMKAVRGIIAQRSPNASADEIQQAAEEYFMALGTAFSTRNQRAVDKAAGRVEEEVDWLAQMGLPGKS